MSLIVLNEEGRVALRNANLTNRVDHIPPHVYRIRLCMEGIDLVKDRKSFTLPEKIYGDHHSHREMIVKAYLGEKRALGVLLMGARGSGKSLLAEDISNQLLSRDIPVFLVDQRIPVEALRTVIMAAGPCVVYLDEMGKIYTEEEDRDKLLTLFSDTALQKVLFIATGNSYMEIPDFMMNRPGRFRYRIEYKNIDPKGMDELLKEYGVRPELHEALRVYSCSDREISYDIMKLVMEQTLESTSVDELRERLELFNIPTFGELNYSIQSILYPEVDFERIKIKEVEEDLIIKFYQGKAPVKEVRIPTSEIHWKPLPGSVPHEYLKLGSWGEITLAVRVGMGRPKALGLWDVRMGLAQPPSDPMDRPSEGVGEVQSPPKNARPSYWSSMGFGMTTKPVLAQSFERADRSVPPTPPDTYDPSRDHYSGE